MSEDNPPCCENCIFWDYHGKDKYDGDQRDHSDCRRFPPTHGVAESKFFVAKFPQTVEYDWCGEHQFKDWKAEDQ